MKEQIIWIKATKHLPFSRIKLILRSKANILRFGIRTYEKGQRRTLFNDETSDYDLLRKVFLREMGKLFDAVFPSPRVIDKMYLQF